MRIVIDMQGAQSTGSRNRGIGRYTNALAEAMIRHGTGHDFIIALNAAFSESIDEIRSSLGGILPAQNFRVWQQPEGVRYLGDRWQLRVAEQLRQAFLNSLSPDIIHVTSLFEGLGDATTTTVPARSPGMPPVVVTLYDLIPAVNRSIYLSSPEVAAWYDEKLEHLKLADHLLAISDASRDEAIKILGLEPDRVTSISGGVDARFRRLDLSTLEQQRILARCGLVRPFVMYTGGIDHRKNVEALIVAFARLPQHIRAVHQLAIVCSVQPPEKARLLAIAVEAGLEDGDVVLTGFVPEDDLIALYSLCKLFIFPSWHEGFGLPVLEAMACGAPAIASNCSSLPEIVGRADALFDPRRVEAISAALERSLCDPAFLSNLSAYGLRRAKEFTWSTCGRKALAAIEGVYAQEHQGRAGTSMHVGARRPKLLYVSPLPPDRSGIADYTAELVPELARHYEIELVRPESFGPVDGPLATFATRTVEWFRQKACNYDRIVYQFGNSHFHSHMFDLLEEFPGIVVLHDFYLSGAQATLELRNGQAHAWTRALLHAHGYGAVKARIESADINNEMMRFPCNLSVLQQAIGIITHSQYSRTQSDVWYGAVGDTDWRIIPQLRTLPAKLDRQQARKALGIAPDTFLVCTMGLLSPTKFNRRLLDAWLNSRLARSEDCQLVYVGENHGGDYGRELAAAIERSGVADRIRITGYQTAESYGQWLGACDVAVQLRTLSRGETSRAVLDCLAHAVPTIVNANGAMAELPDGCVHLLLDDFAEEDLSRALEALRDHPDKCQALGVAGRAYVANELAPEHIAQQYRDAIEAFYERAAFGQMGLLTSIAELYNCPREEGPWMEVAEAMAASFPPRVKPRQLLLDVGPPHEATVVGSVAEGKMALIQSLLLQAPERTRVEPVSFTHDGVGYYSRKFAFQLVGCPMHLAPNEPMNAYAGDILVVEPAELREDSPRAITLAQLRRRGVEIISYDRLDSRLRAIEQGRGPVAGSGPPSSAKHINGQGVPGNPSRSL